ncbi:hypothetical protein EXU48_23890 [Occultella glacieicola]|uniref:Uncharacterized protein n=1 Tax=Occultella glacieicola TaxID=2518684 RepID=A0ABY2DWK1_9MICO|nr:hypothetical protein [Occultella glacieicola]TDE88166.1 hypothetical protein EXU48_23890 [Occultella glacieicola]
MLTTDQIIERMRSNRLGRAYLAEHGAGPGGERFAAWLFELDARLARTLRIARGHQQLADRDWLAEFEAGTAPAQAATNALSEEFGP